MKRKRAGKSPRGLKEAIALWAVIAGVAVVPGGTPVARGQGMVWLNIGVETRTSSEGQRSWAIAATSSDRAGANKVKVRKLHLVLDAHERQQRQCEDCDSLRVDEYHEGAQVVKPRARAWSEGPSISPVEAAADTPR